MPRHDKVKINQAIVQTGGKYRSSTFVLTALFPLACLIFSTPPHQKKRMTAQLPRGWPKHQKSRGQNLPPLKYCCCCSTFVLTAFISLAYLIFSVEDLQLTYFTVYSIVILGHGNNNEMHSGGYLLTNTYPPCNGGSHRRCCRNETSRTFQPAFFSCGEISPLGNPKKKG